MATPSISPINSYSPMLSYESLGVSTYAIIGIGMRYEELKLEENRQGHSIESAMLRIVSYRINGRRLPGHVHVRAWYVRDAY